MFFLIYANSARSQAHYYITPSLNATCPGDPCLTLTQLVAINFSNETNISLWFLQGNHSLDRELSLSRAENVSMMKDARDNGTVFVECGSRNINQSGRFNISETKFAMIKGLHFIGCGGDRVSRVEQFIIEDTIFQGVEGRGTALVLNEVTFAGIARCSFLSNTHGSKFEHHSILLFINDEVLNYLYLNRNLSLSVGGALYSAYSNISIASSNFTHNTAEIGGVVFAHNSSFNVTRSEFSKNRASFGGALVTSGSRVVINDSNFSKNIVESHGGVMITYKDSFSISNTTFTDNGASSSSGVMEIYGESSFNIVNSVFAHNSVVLNGGVMRTFGEVSLNITSCMFRSNKAYLYGGVIESVISKGSSFYIRNSTFTDNRAGYGGVAHIQHISEFIIIVTSCTFISNRAYRQGGVIKIYSELSLIFEIIDSNLTENSAIDGGAVIWASITSFKIENSYFSFNKAENAGKMIFALGCSLHIANSEFYHNLGSLYVFNSNLTFSDDTHFENCTEPSNKTATEDLHIFQEGGAITSFQSTLIFTEESNITISNNQARSGGAILATESKIIVHVRTTVMIANNIATDSNGGGVSLQQSELEIKGNCFISSNHAMRGGGIHATSSAVIVYQSGTLKFINNRAVNGSGLYLELNPKLYLLKLRSVLHLDPADYLLTFRDNHASSHGGAIYVADDTNSGTCSTNNECFIQALALHQELPLNYRHKLLTRNIDFSNNTAIELGRANLFGGLLDRCIPSPFAEVYLNNRTHYTGIAYLENIIHQITLNSIFSLPVRVCFCKSESV